MGRSFGLVSLLAFLGCCVALSAPASSDPVCMGSYYIPHSPAGGWRFSFTGWWDPRKFDYQAATKSPSMTRQFLALLSESGLSLKPGNHIFTKNVPKLNIALTHVYKVYQDGGRLLHMGEVTRVASNGASCPFSPHAVSTFGKDSRDTE